MNCKFSNSLYIISSLWLTVPHFTSKYLGCICYTVTFGGGHGVELVFV